MLTSVQINDVHNNPVLLIITINLYLNLLRIIMVAFLHAITHLIIKGILMYVCIINVSIFQINIGRDINEKASSKGDFGKQKMLENIM